MANGFSTPGVARAAAARSQRLSALNTRLIWFGEQVKKGLNITMRTRLGVAGKILQDMVVANISIPVVKVKGSRSGRLQVIERSKPGEFPRLDISRLQKDIFWRYATFGNEVQVGTTLDYGAILETSQGLKRGFLRRTLNENLPTFRKFLTAKVARIEGGTAILRAEPGN